MRKAKKRFLKLIIFATMLCGIILYFEEKRTEATLSNGKFLILVNDDYYVPEDYEVNLLELRNGEYVSEEMYPYLQEMFDAAQVFGAPDFIDYLNKWAFPDYQSKLVKGLGCFGHEIPEEYRNLPKYNF